MPKGIPTWMKNAGGKAKNAVGDAVVAVKHGGEKAIDGLGRAKQDLDIKRLRPVFLPQIGHDYQIPPFIQILDDDKSFENEVCKGAIGFDRHPNRVPMFAVSRRELDKLGINFTPDDKGIFYYVHPYDNNTYIALDDYFLSLRKQRVAELERIAFDLGASHFKITYKEEKESFVSKNATVKGAARNNKDNGTIDARHSSENREYADTKVEVDIQWKEPRDPKRPELLLYQEEIDIKNLIEMRMENPSVVKSKTYLLNYNTRREMKLDDAIKIDGALKVLKMHGTATLQSRSELQSRTKIEYLIEF